MKAIEVRNLTYTYPDGTPALKNINFSVYENETLGIIGPNGAGKTTLLLNLIGILKGNSEIYILGKRLEGKNMSYIRSKVGLVFQDPDAQLFMPSVFEDVSFGPLNMNLKKEEVIERANEALRKVNLKDKADKLPHHLSLGEKKRIAIATVLSMQPEILLLDEPTSNLDPKSRFSLIKLLRELPGTKIIASHDLELIRELATRVILLDQGKLIKEAQTLTILSDYNLLARHSLAPPESRTCSY